MAKMLYSNLDEKYITNNYVYSLLTNKDFKILKDKKRTRSCTRTLHLIQDIISELITDQTLLKFDGLKYVVNIIFYLEIHTALTEYSINSNVINTLLQLNIDSSILNNIITQFKDIIVLSTDNSVELYQHMFLYFIRFVYIEEQNENENEKNEKEKDARTRWLNIVAVVNNLINIVQLINKANDENKGHYDMMKITDYDDATTKIITEIHEIVPVMTLEEIQDIRQKIVDSQNMDPGNLISEYKEIIKKYSYHKKDDGNFKKQILQIKDKQILDNIIIHLLYFEDVSDELNAENEVYGETYVYVNDIFTGIMSALTSLKDGLKSMLSYLRY